MAVTRLPAPLDEIVPEVFAGDPLVRVDIDEGVERGDIDAAIRRQAPDMVIVGVPVTAGATDPNQPCDQLRRHRDRPVLAVWTEARPARLCELRRSAQPIPEVSVAGLRDVVRGVIDTRPR